VSGRGRFARGGLALAPAVLMGSLFAFQRPTDEPARVKTGPAAADEAVLELKGEVKAARSVTINVPFTLPAETTILHLAASGTRVVRGDVVAELDGTALQETLRQARSDLAATEADLARGEAEARLAEEQERTERQSAARELEHAQRDAQRQDLVSPVEAEQGRLRLADAEQAVREMDARLGAGARVRAADLESRRQRCRKAAAQVERAREACAGMTLRAPQSGVVRLLPNFRLRANSGNPPAFKAGDSVWAGASLLELPDLSSVNVLARVDEVDRARVRPGQKAAVRVEALPDALILAEVADIAPVARVDFQQVPPARTFDVSLRLSAVDARLRPGMAASARIVGGPT
jgi:multidrug resistance efflux pump